MDLDNIVREFEHRSSHICEICGAEGSRTNDGKWIKVLCDEHKRVSGRT